MQIPTNNANENSDVSNKHDNPCTDHEFNMVANASTFNAIKKHRPNYYSPKVSSTLISGTLPHGVFAECKGEAVTDINRSSTTRTLRSRPQSRIDRNPVKQSEQPPLGQKTQSYKIFRDDVFIYPIDNEALMYDPAIQTLHHLNETAYYVWCHYDSQSAEDLANTLAHRYNVDIQTAFNHVTEVIRLFRIGGLLAVEPLDESYE